MNKLIIFICLLPVVLFGQGFGYVGVVANRTNGVLLTPTNFINIFVGGSNVVVVPTNNGVGWKLIINAASGGAGGVDGSANSNLSYSIGADATNYANGVTNSSIVRQTQLTTASNALVTYANSVTNSSIVRQLELTAASNSLVTYANSVTNSSIARQAELTAASNALLSVTYTVGANLTNYANGVTNSSIVRQTELTSASNALVAFSISTTNSSIVRQAELAAASNALLSVTYTVGANSTTHVNNATVALTNSLLSKVDELSGVSTGQTFYGGIVASNLTYNFSTTDNVATNDTANSNLVVDVDISTRDIYLTNSISLTNWSNLAAGTSKNFVRFLSPILINRTVVYPTLGGTSFGIRTFTNANSPMWTTLTQGVTYALSGTTRGTSVHLSISEWK